jgi:hypothetical protein
LKKKNSDEKLKLSSSLESKWKLPNKISPKFSSKKAHEMQRRLSKKLLFKNKLPENIDYIAGVDVAFLEGTSIGAVAVSDYTCCL